MNTLHALPVALLGIGAPALGVTSDDFESYIVGPDRSEYIGVTSLDDTTITTSSTGTHQGPGLVADGCTYSTAGGPLQWNGRAYYGSTTKTLNTGDGDGDLWLSYHSPVTDVSFDLAAFEGYVEVAAVNVFDSTGAVIHTSGSIGLLSNATPVYWSYSAADIATIQIDGQSQIWSPLIDNHRYGTGPLLELSITGACPGPMTAEVENASPGGMVHIIHSNGAGAIVIPAGFPCAGTALGLSGRGVTVAGSLTADGVGSTTLAGSAPKAGCGSVWVQALDETTCTTSNRVGL